MSVFGNTLRKIRKAADVSLRQLAREASISPTYLSQIEQGKAVRPPTADRIERMAKVLKTDSDQLCFLAGRLPTDVEAALKKFPRQATHVLRYTGVTKMKKTSL